jgi:hypothetical protein
LNRRPGVGSCWQPAFSAPGNSDNNVPKSVDYDRLAARSRGEPLQGEAEGATRHERASTVLQGAFFFAFFDRKNCHRKACPTRQFSASLQHVVDWVQSRFELVINYLMHGNRKIKKRIRRYFRDFLNEL